MLRIPQLQKRLMMKFKLAVAFAMFSAVAHAATTPPKEVFSGDQFTYSWGTTPGAFP
jgi:hypothetical protein